MAILVIEVTKGVTVRLTGIFKTDDVEADPDTVVGTIETPDNSVASLSPTLRDGTTSTYDVLVTPLVTGFHTVQMKGSYNGGTEFAIKEYDVRSLKPKVG